MWRRPSRSQDQLPIPKHTPQERTGGGSLQLATERVQSPPFSKRKLIDIRAQRPTGMLHRDKSTSRTIIQSAFALSLSLSRNCWKRESFQGCGQCSKKSQKTGRDVYCNLRPRNCPIRASGFDLGGLAVVNLAIRQMPSWNTHAVFFVSLFLNILSASAMLFCSQSHTLHSKEREFLFLSLSYSVGLEITTQTTKYQPHKRSAPRRLASSNCPDRTQSLIMVRR